MARKLKNIENEKLPLDDFKNDEIIEKLEKWEMNTVGPGIWRKNWKSRELRNIHFMTWNMARKLKKVENLEMSTLGCGISQENWKSWNMRNFHLTTWKITKSLKNGKIEKCTLKDLEYGEKTKNHGKWEIHTLGREIWWGILKRWKM
jgi:hypothetical protein